VTTNIFTITYQQVTTPLNMTHRQLLDAIDVVIQVPEIELHQFADSPDPHRKGILRLFMDAIINSPGANPQIHGCLLDAE
jgi:hypothetical protein